VEIEFIEYSELVDREFYPRPAKEVLPNWWQTMAPYRSHAEEYEANGEAGSTGKRCVPMMDSMTSGYLLFLPTDISVEEHDGDLWFEPAYVPFIDYHPAEQIDAHPWFPEGWTRVPKFVNTFGIRTPEGVSCLFKTPSHHDLPFTIFDGVVDTDTFNLPVGLPFVLNDPNWRGVIPQGTPIAQVIPFRREVWSHKVTADYESTGPIADEQMSRLRAEMKNGYRSKFWNRKNYS
jgi:hypothetical protein